MSINSQGILKSQINQPQQLCCIEFKNHINRIWHRLIELILLSTLSMTKNDSGLTVGMKMLHKIIQTIATMETT